METFPNAPIQEAILDIFVTLPPAKTLEELKGIGLALGERFPQIQERVSLVGGIEFKPSGETSTTSSRQVAGYLFTSSAEAKAFQARLDGFTFNKLRPYKAWNQFVAEAKELWYRYRAVANPVLVPRISLRYINRIEIPFPFNDFRDYCLLFPSIPAKMPQELASYFMNYSMPIKEAPGSLATIIVTFEPPLSVRPVLPLILDIGVTSSFDALSASSDTIWSHFESMRLAKNNLFDSSLTEEAKRLFR